MVPGQSVEILQSCKIPGVGTPNGWWARNFARIPVKMFGLFRAGFRRFWPFVAPGAPQNETPYVFVAWSSCRQEDDCILHWCEVEEGFPDPDVSKAERQLYRLHEMARMFEANRMGYCKSTDLETGLKTFKNQTKKLTTVCVRYKY